MIRTGSLFSAIILLLVFDLAGNAGSWRAKDFDVFLKAEGASSTYGFREIASPRTPGYSGKKILDLYETSAPLSSGYYAKYLFDLEQAGNYFLVVWVQALDTPYSSPFTLRLDKGKKWNFRKETARRLPAQIPYGQEMTGYYVGPVALRAGRHSLSVSVAERRAYSDKAYNLIMDAVGLTRKDPAGETKLPAVCVTVDATKTAERFTPLTDLSQGGIAAVATPAFWEAVAPIINHLGTSFVRIDHVFDDGYYGVVQREPDGSLGYDWRRLDAVLSEIGKPRAKPFFCLSYMPAALSRDGSGRQPPQSLEKWETLCRRLVEHLKTRFHWSGLYYEIWNEPDVQAFWKGSQGDYFDLYRAAAQTIKDTDPTARVGGPAVSNVVGAWPGAFLQFVKSRHLPLDFVSWHLYSQDPAAYAYDAEYVTQLLSKLHFAENVEQFLTEWNASSTTNVANDAYYNAARTAAVLSVLQAANVARAFFFMPKEASGPQDLYGGLGLVGANDVPKPSYDCLYAFNRMRNGEKLKVDSTDGEVGAFGVMSNGTFKVLLWNYSRRQPFGRPRKINIRLNLAGTPLSSGMIDQSEYLIDSRHSRGAGRRDLPDLEFAFTKSFNTKKGILKETVSLENGGVLYMELHERKARGLSPPAPPRSRAAHLAQFVQHAGVGLKVDGR
ncbi:MAG: GH39 family glycosyl hydrolase [Syntrophobacteraceae bacterium]